MVMMNPPPIPILCDVTTPLQNRVATAESTAVPPISNILLNSVNLDLKGVRVSIKRGYT